MCKTVHMVFVFTLLYIALSMHPRLQPNVSTACFIPVSYYQLCADFLSMKAPLLTHRNKVVGVTGPVWQKKRRTLSVLEQKSFLRLNFPKDCIKLYVRVYI